MTQKNILELSLLYDLTWKDVMYILGQTLTPNSKTRVLGKVIAYGDEWFDNESVEKREDEITALPTGNQVVPITEPDWERCTPVRHTPDPAGTGPGDPDRRACSG